MTTDLQEQAAPLDENKIIAERRAKLAALRSEGIAFPNDFKPQHKAADLHAQYAAKTREELEAEPVTVVLAGRMMLKREAGKKAAFATLQDASGPKADGRIQICHAGPDRRSGDGRAAPLRPGRRPRRDRHAVQDQDR